MNLSNHFRIIFAIFTGNTNIDDIGFYHICNAVEVMPKLIAVKLNLADTKRLKLHPQIKVHLKFPKGIEYEYDEEGEKQIKLIEKEDVDLYFNKSFISQ